MKTKRERVRRIAMVEGVGLETEAFTTAGSRSLEVLQSTGLNSNGGWLFIGYVHDTH